jgi:UDP-N-acetyl-D-mannosaminuronate dehydrogenase
LTYYEEDNPEIESAENEDISPEEQLIRDIEKAAAEQRPMLMPHVDKDAERHEEMMEMLGGIFIQMSRLYDAVMLSLDHDMMKLAESYHSKGKLLSDPPILEEDAWS